MSSLYVLSGIQAAGKTTIGRMLAGRFARGVFIDGDTIRAMVVAGRVEMSPDPSKEAIEQLLLRYEGGLAVAASYLRAGFEVVFADVIIGAIMPRFIALVPCPRFHMIFLNPNLDAVRRNEAQRAKSAYGPVWSFTGLHQILIEETPRIGLWLDSSGQRPDETTDAIIAQSAASLVSRADFVREA